VKTTWETCTRREKCAGAALSPRGSCLAHLDRDGELTALLRSVGDGGLDARGVEFDELLLTVVLAAVPRTAEEKPLLMRCDFTQARFPEGARFDEVEFGRETRFDGATFGARTSFAGASFGERTSFRRATFGRSVRFDRCVFGNRVSFANAQFGDGARFEGSRFGNGTTLVDTVWGSDASFEDAVFGARLRSDGAAFVDRAFFRNTVFASEASFRKTTFGVNAAFEGASFGRDPSFSGSTFGRNANFADTRFAPGSSFRRVTFGKLATFRGATFGDRAWFTDATFGAGAAFAHATFEGRTRFNLTTFVAGGDFHETTFGGQVSFESAVFGGRATFRLAIFERARSFGPLAVDGALLLDQASFLEAARLEVAAERLLVRRSRFPEGVDIRVRWSEIELDESDFGGPGILAAALPFKPLDESKLAQRLPPGRGQRPRLLSVRGANVADLVVSGLDLRACRFFGAHNLDRLRIEGDSLLARAPRGASRRRVIAEEQEWRARRKRRLPEWAAPEFGLAGDGVEKPRQLAPDAIASIYRALHRGRQSNGDAPGAADFYFGEMEMRRLDRSSQRAERAILWLYWLVSGYALRSLRALTALVVTIVVFAVLFRYVGFEPRVGLMRALLFSAESTSSLFRIPDTKGTVLTEAGEVLQIALRLLGPLFFGLALLSLRGRVRR
jgi:Pentapeptide repeats (9 copies)